VRLKLVIIRLAYFQMSAGVRIKVFVHNWQNLLFGVDSIVSFFVIEEFLCNNFILLVDLILALKT
jgi:hypothetical protein